MSPLSVFSGPYAFLARMGVFFLTLFVAIAFGFYEGWKWERPAVKVAQDKLTAFAAQVKTIGEEQTKTSAAKDAANQKAKEKVVNEYTNAIKIFTASWAADRTERDRLRKQLADSRSRPVPKVTVSSELSCDAASNAAISAAVSSSVAEARAAFDECRAAAYDFRDSAAQQLEQAERNTAALMCGVTWAKAIQ